MQRISLHKRTTVEVIRKAAFQVRSAVRQLARQLYILNLLGAANQATGTRVAQYTVFESDLSRLDRVVVAYRFL